MGLFSGPRKIIHAVNPIETAKPGARLIRDSVQELMRKKSIGMEPVTTMSDDDRQFVVRRIRRSGIVSMILGSVLSCLALWSGIQQGSAVVISMSVIIVASSALIAHLKFWHADMVEKKRSITLSRFTAGLFRHQE